MQTHQIISLLIPIAVGVAVFLVMRSINLWYFKVNERLFQQQKTNFLLERIWAHLGATNTTDITLEDTETGEKKTISIDAYIRYMNENPGSEAYRIATKKPTYSED